MDTMRMLEALVLGIAIPVIIALLGREPIGKLLLAGQHREDTALKALIELVKESVAGWREANSAVMRLSDTVAQGNVDHAARSVDLHASYANQEVYLSSIDDKVSALIRIFADRDKPMEAIVEEACS